MKPKTNQEIGTNTDHFPSYKQCNQIISGNKHQHRSGEKAQITLKSRLMGITLHVTLTVHMNTETYKRNCDHHRCALSIKTQKPFNLQSPSPKPRVQGNENRRSRNKNLIKNKETKESPCSLSLKCNAATSTSTNPAPSQACKTSSLKRSKNSTQIHFFIRIKQKKRIEKKKKKK
jgi:hypothetical protein